MDGQQLTGKRQKPHATRLSLGPGVRLAEVELALSRAGFTVVTSREPGVMVIREIPPLIAPRSRYAR